MVRTLATIVAAALFACAHGFAPAGPVGAFSAFSGGAVVQTESIAVRKQQGASSDGAATMIRHGKRKAELNLPADQRKALLRALTTETIRHGRITTTLIRAKAAQPHIEKMIGLGKRGDLHARRQVGEERCDATRRTVCVTGRGDEQGPGEETEKVHKPVHALGSASGRSLSSPAPPPSTGENRSAVGARCRPVSPGLAGRAQEASAIVVVRGAACVR